MPAGFRYPVNPAPKVAIFDRLQSFTPEQDAECAALPATILSQALRSSWQPTHALVVFTGSGYGELTGSDRDAVWDQWGVPVFEHRIDSSGRVLAEECEAHDGLHLRSGAEWSGERLTARCPCGLDTPRIPEVINPVEIRVNEMIGAAA